MFLARQGVRDRVHSQNPVVAGLRDPKTPLSAHDVIGRSHPCIARWGCLGRAYLPPLFILLLAGIIYCIIALNITGGVDMGILRGGETGHGWVLVNSNRRAVKYGICQSIQVKSTCRRDVISTWTLYLPLASSAFTLVRTFISIATAFSIMFFIDSLYISFLLCHNAIYIVLLV